MDEALAVADRPTLKGAERRELLRALSELTAAAGSRGNGAEPRPVANAREWAPVARLSREDEQLVARLRSALAGLAGSVRGESAEVAEAALRALDGAESVARREILRGRSGRLPQLLPSFAYLVVLPIVGQAEALRVSQRAARLVESGGEAG